jgi:hypothetical protein
MIHEPNLLQPGRKVTQTVKIDGVRYKVTQTMRADGTVDVKRVEAAPLEEDLQAAVVDELRARDDYRTWFLLAGDMGAADRGPKAIATALKTGLEKGEPDLRLYVWPGNLILIELKVLPGGTVKKHQADRHDDLRGVGFDVHVVWAADAGSAVSQVVAILEDALMDNGQYQRWLQLPPSTKKGID